MNNNLVALDHKLRILLEENQECIERFENIHPEFYQYLLRKKFVIDDNVGKHGQSDPVRTVQIDPSKTA